MKFNPFRPNSIATDELFQGRSDEMQFIERSLFQTKNGNPQHFLIEGERGLGKSSLFFRVAQQAKDEKAIDDKKIFLNFMVLNIELDSSQAFLGINKPQPQPSTLNLKPESQPSTLNLNP
jgi:Cdc6-like AAA superfamily ATPase